MRLPMLVISLLAAVPGAAAAQTATVVAPAATVSGVTVTNAGTYTAQSISGPSRAGQLSSTGTVGRASDWHFVSDSTDVAARSAPSSASSSASTAIRSATASRYIWCSLSPAGHSQSEYRRHMHTANIAVPNLKIGALCLLGYGFDNAWEIVPRRLDGADLVSGPHAG